MTDRQDDFPEYHYGCGLDEMLAKELDGTEFRYGHLDFPEPMGEGNYPEFIEDPPEFMRSGWTWHHEVDTVLSPDRGVLLLRRACGSSPRELGDSIEHEFEELRKLDEKIRNRIALLPHWQTQHPPIGIGVVATHARADELPQLSTVPDEVVINRDELPDLCDRLHALFRHYEQHRLAWHTDRAAELVDLIGEKQSMIGGMISHEDILEMYAEFDRRDAS